MASLRNRHHGPGAGCAALILFVFAVVLVSSISCGVQACRAEDAPVATPAPAFSVSYEALTGRLWKPGGNRLYFGLRAQAELELPAKFTAVGVLQGSALSDGEAVNLSLDNPASFQTAEAYLSLGRQVSGPLSVFAVGGGTVGIEAGQAALDTTAWTLAVGPSVRTPLGTLWLGGGWHQAAGDGFKLLGYARVPLKDATSVIVDGAIGGPGSFVRTVAAVKF